MKTVMCFGASQVWGYTPGTGERMAWNKRWTGVLQQNLGNEIRIIEEGLNGRTTIWDDPFQPDRNARTILPVLLESHSPIDLFMMLIGANDLKSDKPLGAVEAARGCRTLIQIVQKSRCGPKKGIPKILLMAPPAISGPAGLQKLLFNSRSEEESRKLPGLYEDIAKFCQCSFFDVSKVVTVSSLDGVHFDEGENSKLGLALKDVVLEILKGE